MNPTAAIAILSGISLVSVGICFWLAQRLSKNLRSHQIQLRDMYDQASTYREFTSRTIEVLNHAGAGVAKRVAENLEVTEAILHLAPNLFEECHGLRFWLKAEHEFLSKLYKTCLPYLNHAQRNIWDTVIEKEKRDAIFEDL